MKKIDFFVEAVELGVDLEDKDSKLHCQKCKALLPIFRLILKAKSVKDGKTFNFKCRKCKYINEIKREIIK